MLAGFDDGRADEGVGARAASLSGLRLAPAGLDRAGTGSTRRCADDDAAGRRRRPRPPTAGSPTRRRLAASATPASDSEHRRRRLRRRWTLSAQLTPILTTFWDDPESWTLETYETHDGYQALRKAPRR